MSVVVPDITVSNIATGAGAPFRAAVRVTTFAPGNLSVDFADGSTLNGVLLVTGDRILIKNQTVVSENGIYIVETSGTPTRALDYAEGQKAAGTFIFVTSGSIRSMDTLWMCTSSSGSDTIGTDPLTYSQMYSSVDLPYRLTVRVATIEPGLVNGTSYIVGSIVNGIALNAGDRVLVKNSLTASDNGIYVVQPGSAPPLRADDFAINQSVAGYIINVTSGTVGAGSAWICINAAVGDVVGISNLEFRQILNSTSTPIRAYVRVTGITNINVATLTPLATLNGVILALGDRVLVKNQTTATQNGIYLVTASGGIRTDDFASGQNAAGAIISVTEGTTRSAGTMWTCTNTATSAVIGTNNLSFNQILNSTSVPIRATVRVASTAAITLTSMPASVNGITLAVGDRVLVKDQTTTMPAGRDRGIYVFNGTGLAATRADDFAAGQSAAGALIYAASGSTLPGVFWFCTNLPGTDIIDNATTFLTFTNLVNLASTQTLTNKTLTSPTITTPTITTIVNSGNKTVPTGTDTFTLNLTAATLTGKSLSDSTTFIINVTTATRRIGFNIGSATANVTTTINTSNHDANRTITLPNATTTLVGTDTTDTLTNKTLTLPTIASVNNGGTVSMPFGTHVLVARDSTDILTNKTITATTNQVGVSYFAYALAAAQDLAFNANGQSLDTATWTTPTVPIGVWLIRYEFNYGNSATDRFLINYWLDGVQVNTNGIGVACSPSSSNNGFYHGYTTIATYSSAATHPLFIRITSTTNTVMTVRIQNVYITMTRLTG